MSKMLFYRLSICLGMSTKFLFSLRKTFGNDVVCYLALLIGSLPLRIKRSIVSNAFNFFVIQWLNLQQGLYLVSSFMKFIHLCYICFSFWLGYLLCENSISIAGGSLIYLVTWLLSPYSWGNKLAFNCSFKIGETGTGCNFIQLK